jgi:hypothetical protein
MAGATKLLPVLADVRAAAREVRELARVFVRARVSITAQPFAGTLERLCALTPYAAELIADDALRAGRGSRLELFIAASEDDEAVTRVRARFASLGAHGIKVIVRSQHSPALA